ncbi:MAG: V-type ATP synthase subunit I [Oscillospiraceae bacterium]|nr:V-type ATP synthase subunit I [Oscillospiraceae bacterium]
MAKLTMKWIEIVALLKDRKKIVERLQRCEIVEFSDFQDEALAKMNTTSHVAHLEKNINTAVEAKEILNEYAPTKKSMLSTLNGRREMETSEFGKYVEQRETYLKICYDLINLKKVITENRAAIIRTQTLMDALKIWLDLDIPMQFKGTKYTRCFVGVVPKKRTSEDILLEIAKINPKLEMIHVEVVSAYKEQSCVTIICHNEVADETSEVLRQIGFVFSSDPTKHVPIIRMQRYENELIKYNSEIDESINKIKSYADRIDEIEFLADYSILRKEKYIALNKIGLTKNTFIISGFIPEKYAKKCIYELETQFTAAINLTSPSENEDVPVLLENGEFSAPVESVAEMYSLPGKKDIDPCAIMAFFYYMFFGIMLSDAGYGVLMVIGTAIALKKFNIEGSMKKTLKMFLYCGISTVFWGALFGSWFGDIVPIIYEQFLHIDAPNMALWFEPIKDPIKFLLAAFAFGIVHLFVGLGVSFKMAWDKGQKLDAILDVIPIYIFVLGVAPLCAAVLVSVPTAATTIGKYMAIAGVALIILTAGRKSKNVFAKLGLGLYGLYNVASGYLSDILSYSRLLALGLATGSIAGVVNLMGSMPSNLVFKGILLTIVFIVGHPLNMAINLLGAYVHTNRLQFVEFFSKFYEGGGRAFHPLKVNTKYIKFKENN